MTNTDLALLANTPVQAESLLHSLEQVTGGIGLYINPNKTEFMILKQNECTMGIFFACPISSANFCPRDFLS